MALELWYRNNLALLLAVSLVPRESNLAGRRALALVWMIVILLAWRTPAFSIELTCPSDIDACGGEDVIWITGEIERGDFRKFAAELRRRGPVVTTVVLARSGGGLLGEAVKIGRLIRLLRLATSVGWGVVDPSTRTYAAVYYPVAATVADAKSWTVPALKPAQAICASACVDIWVAGYPRLGYSFLSVHATQVDISQFDWITLDRIAELNRGADAFVRNYYAEMGAPQDLSNEAQTVTNNSVKFITFPYIEERLLPMDHVQMATILRHCDGITPSARDARIQKVDMQVVAEQTSCMLEALGPLRAEAWMRAFGSEGKDDLEGGQGHPGSGQAGTQ